MLSFTEDEKPSVMRSVPILLCAVAFFLLPVVNAQENARLEIVGKTVFQPLEEITVRTPKAGALTVIDGKGNAYFESGIDGQLSFPAGGALGSQSILLLDEDGRLLGRASFKVEGKTYIKDETGKYDSLLQTLYFSMAGNWGREAQIIRYNGRFYHFFVRWLRDHVHTLKGMKYFYPELHSGIDLYADTQREDGMIWDNVYPRNKEKNWWDHRFRYGDFIRDAENGLLEFKRIPVENDVEYLFIEGLYYTWKATGDDAWMASHLDKALKAVQYATTGPYRWSEKYQLLKRGFTIDTWDFQSNEDAAISGGDIMVVKLGKTRFGIMFGDNTGMAASCSYLAEMLRHSGREEEAAGMEQLGEELQERIDELAWNGAFYTHHVPEDPNVKRDLGVDLSQQASLSNAYSLNRNLSHEQCVAIIKTYQAIKKSMPASSPGEWYAIYPPFEYGFGKDDSSAKWEYMNGGVTSIVAGELAHGAFEHGFEAYGVEILNRVAALAAKTDGFLHCAYRGSMEDEPERAFEVLDLSALSNVDYPGDKATFNGATIGQGGRDGQKIFNGIPFQVLDLEGRNRNCLRLAADNLEANLPVNAKAVSIYLLHTGSTGPYAGHLEVVYADGSTYTDYITTGEIGNWWTENLESKKEEVCRKAWRSNNDQYVAFYTYGLNNPYPDKEIRSLRFSGAKGGREWNIKSVTLSDYPVYFPPDIISYGIPDNWGAAAVVYALVEGLAGVKDEGAAMNKALIAPRWVAAETNTAEVMIHYPASDGYVSYKYQYDPERQALTMQVTGNAAVQKFRILLPAGYAVKQLLKDGVGHPHRMETVEGSAYACFEDEEVGVKTFELLLEGD